MISKFKPRLAFVALMLVCTAIGARAQQYSMAQAVEYALANNREAKNIRLDELSAKAKVREITGIGLPQVSFSANLIDNVKIQRVLVPANTFDPTAPADVVIPLEFGVPYQSDVKAQVSQLIFNGSYIVGLRAARTYRELTEKNVKQTDLQVIQNVQKAYYGVLVSKKRELLIQSNIDRIDTLFRETKALNQAGFAEEIDVKRLEVSLNNLKTELENMKAISELSLNLLKYQMALPYDAELVLTDTLNLAALTAITEEPIDNRIELSILETQHQLAKLDLMNIQATGLPVLAAFGSWGANNGRRNFDKLFTEEWFDNAMIGLTFSWNIFDGTQRQYKAQQARITINKVENSRELLRQSLELERKQAATSLRSSMNALKNQERNMSLAEDVYNMALKKYKAGTGSNLEVNQANADYKDARIAYYSALYDALTASVDYNKANGTLIKQ